MTRRSFYGICMHCTVTILSLALIVTVLPQAADRVLNSPIVTNPRYATRIAEGVVGLVVSFFVSVFWPGMMFECLTSKDLRAPSKAAWVILIAVTNVFGALAYYFVRYRKHRVQTAEI